MQKTQKSDIPIITQADAAKLKGVLDHVHTASTPSNARSAARRRLDKGELQDGSYWLVQEDDGKQVSIVKRGAPPTDAGSTPAKKKTQRKPKEKSQPSLLDCAATILSTASEPMNCKAIVAQIIEQKMWTTSGKTPHSTLYAAIIREIRDKGDAARFRKADRGTFELAAA